MRTSAIDSYLRVKKDEHCRSEGVAVVEEIF
jgi:hypothetical protein